jgi:hypothetical protein
MSIFKEELKNELPCGVLRTQGMVYWLLCPFPVPKDSWEGDNCYRFLVVPKGGSKPGDTYPPARHLVTNSFAVEYMSNLPSIRRKVLVQYDIDTLEQPNMGYQVDLETRTETVPEMENTND